MTDHAAALETAKTVLAKASFYDQSFATPDMGIAVAWAEALGAVNRRDALNAVTAHYSRPAPRRIAPGDVLAGVRAIRDERLRAAGNSEPAYDGDDVLGGLRAIREHRRAIADGRAKPDERPELLPRRDVDGLVARTADQLPRMPKIKHGEGVA